MHYIDYKSDFLQPKTAQEKFGEKGMFAYFFLDLFSWSGKAW